MQGTTAKRPTESGRAAGAASPARRQIVLLAALAAAAVAFVWLRVWRAPGPVRLHLDSNVTLATPPPLSGSDLRAVQAGLLRLDSLRARAASHSSDPAVHEVVGVEAQRAGDLLTALDEYSTVIRMRPDSSPQVYDLLGRCQVELGLFTRAQETYQRLIQRAPAAAVGFIGLRRAYSLLGKRGMAIHALEQATRSVPADDISGRLGLASEYEMRDELPRALQIAQEARARAPQNAAATLATAHLLFRLGRLAESQSLLEQLLTAHPDDPLVRRYLAAVLVSPLAPRRDPDQAEDYLLQSLDRNPKDAAACQQLAELYQDLGRYRQAAYMYIWLLALTPDSASGRMQLSRAYARLGDQRASEQQRELANRLLDRDREEARLKEEHDHRPTDPAARLAHAQHYETAGQFGKALVEVQAAFLLAPASTAVRSELTALYRQIRAPLPPAVSRRLS